MKVFTIILSIHRTHPRANSFLLNNKTNKRKQKKERKEKRKEVD